jgi:hypothetical protein
MSTDLKAAAQVLIESKRTELAALERAARNAVAHVGLIVDGAAAGAIAPFDACQRIASMNARLTEIERDRALLVVAIAALESMIAG